MVKTSGKTGALLFKLRHRYERNGTRTDECIKLRGVIKNVWIERYCNCAAHDRVFGETETVCAGTTDSEIEVPGLNQATIEGQTMNFKTSVITTA